jgi:hypothetical protein
MRTALLIAAILIQGGYQNTLNLITSNPTSNSPGKTTLAIENQLQPSTANWFLYTSKDGSYTALFPGEPQENHLHDSVDISEFSTTTRIDYSDPEAGYYYNIVTTKYSKKLSKKEINELMKSMIQPNEHDVDGFKYKRKFTFNGYTTHEYFVYGDNRWGEASQYRTFFDARKSTLYSISVSTGGEGNLSEDLDTPLIKLFLDSLKLK